MAGAEEVDPALRKDLLEVCTAVSDFLVLAGEVGSFLFFLPNIMLIFV